MSTESHILNELRKVGGLSFQALLQKLMEEWPKGHNQFFLPANMLSAVQETIVDHELRKICPNMSDSEHSKYVREISTTSTRLFCLLVWKCKDSCPFAIKDFIDNGITDKDLPFQRITHTITDSPLKLSKFILCKGDHSTCGQMNHSGCGIPATEKWEETVISSLDRDQWAVLAPRFIMKQQEVPHYDFPDCMVLPFTEYNWDERKSGGYGSVWSVRIHSAHHDLSPANVSEVLYHCLLTEAYN
jgi:hypothetical protein